MGEAAVKVTGLREFSRALRKTDASLPKALRLALNDAAEVVVGPAKAAVPRRSGRAAGTIKARSTARSVRVSAGGSRAPYYPWLDFGGRVGIRNSVTRAVVKEGRYIYPAYHRARDSGEFERVLSDSLMRVARTAGLGIEGHL